MHQRVFKKQAVKYSRWQEIINIRGEIESKRTIHKINQRVGSLK